jgi:hypothetical protein
MRVEHVYCSELIFLIAPSCRGDDYNIGVARQLGHDPRLGFVLQCQNALSTGRTTVDESIVKFAQIQSGERPLNVSGIAATLSQAVGAAVAYVS